MKSSISSGAVSLITNGPTNLTKVYSSSTVAREDVNFECQFDGSQNVTIEWFFSSIQLSNSSHHTIINSYNSSVLTILSANVSDIGAYICNVSNDVSSETRTAYLAVLGMVTILFYSPFCLMTLFYISVDVSQTSFFIST